MTTMSESERKHHAALEKRVGQLHSIVADVRALLAQEQRERTMSREERTALVNLLSNAKSLLMVCEERMYTMGGQ